jgi:hypothetical protein
MVPFRALAPGANPGVDVRARAERPRDCRQGDRRYSEAGPV